MKSAPFEYLRPRTVAEASTLLAQEGVSTAAIAGGQSLVPMLSLRAAQIDLLVDLSRLDELKAVTETREHVDTRPRDRRRRRTSRRFARAAVGGSVALADPAADWPGCLIVLGASVRIASRNGTRKEPVSAFIKGLYSTSLATGEIVLGFDIPRLEGPLRWGFAKVVRKSGAFA